MNPSLFYQSGKKTQNDTDNKNREYMLAMMVNADDFHHPTEKEKWNDIKRNFLDCIKDSISVSYDRIVLIPKAGRANNYDFIIQVEKNMFIQEQLKIEFKYGTDIYKYPQFISIYVSNTQFQLVNENYIHYWYFNYFKDYLNLLKIDGNISFSEYKKNINTTTYKHHLFSVIHDKLKSKSVLKKEAEKIVNKSIETFLNRIDLRDINFDIIEKKLNQQQDKIFVFCKEGNFTSQKLPEIKIDRNRFSIHRKNTLCLFDTLSNKQYKLLLRWKNYKGCSGPAWQISIKK